MPLWYISSLPELLITFIVSLFIYLFHMNFDLVTVRLYSTEGGAYYKEALLLKWVCERMALIWCPALVSQMKGYVEISRLLHEWISYFKGTHSGLRHIAATKTPSTNDEKCFIFHLKILRYCTFSFLVL